MKATTGLIWRRIGTSGEIFFEVQPTRCNAIQYSLLLSILYTFQAVSPPIIRSSKVKTVHTASGICQACLLLPLAVAASKLDICQMLCVQFWLLSSWWWEEKPP